MASSSKPQLLIDPVGKTLLRLATPMFFGFAAIILFNVVDTFYVGRLGVKPLAAMSFTFPVVFVVMSIAMGLGIGATAAVSRAIGEGDSNKVRRLTTDSLTLAFLLVILVAGLGLLAMRPLFSLLGATPEMLPLISDYMTPWLLGVGLLVIPMVGNSAIRATGDTKTPSIVMMIAGGVNVVLDPLLIFGLGPFPRLELQGAAIATVISWIVAFAAAIWILFRREKMIDLRWPGVRAVSDSWRKILYVGLPAAGTNILVPLSAGLLTRMIASYGDHAVAGFGVGHRLESLAMVGIGALSTAVTPFAGQNYGAGAHDRIRAAVRFCTKAALVWGTTVGTIYLLLSRPLAALFAEESAVITATVAYLIIVPLSFGPFGVAVLINAVFNVVNKPLTSAFIIAMRLFVFSIPLAWLGSQFWGLEGIFAGIAAGNILVSLVAWGLMARFLSSPTTTSPVPAVLPAKT